MESTGNCPLTEYSSPTGLSMHQWTDAYINVLLKSVASDMGLQIIQMPKQNLMMSAGNPPLAERPSPTGLSMHQWTDAYINVLLRSVGSDMGLHITQMPQRTHEDLKTRQVVLQTNMALKTERSSSREVKNVQIVHAHKDKKIRMKILPSEEDMILRYVDKVIAESVAIVQADEDDFIESLVWDTLHCASSEIMQEEDFRADEHNSDLFNQEFVKEELKSALEDVKADITGNKRSSYHGQDKTSCLKSRSSDEHTIPKTSVKAKEVTKSKNSEPKFDLIYIRNRLRATFGKDSDRALARYVQSNVPARGSWSEQFRAVDEAILRIVREHKSGHPLVTDFYDPPPVEKTSETGKGDVSVIEKPTEMVTTESSATPELSETTAEQPATTEVADPPATQKMKSTPSFSRTRRFINRVRKSLFSFRSKK